MNEKQMAKLLKWKVDPRPTGRYRSFESRSWPSAFYKHEREHLCACIQCADEYYPKGVKSGNHPELSLLVYVYTEKERRMVVLKKKFKTLLEIKEELPKFLCRHTEYLPEDLRGE